ncbi:protein yellow-like isoform X3 [Odontomachus brunneus]|nr:protein yellow-like isoform X3 [Odontomachus brunneus]XP_032684641.1 protein yellow-like isoform X3 [Odontomachus brunneus]XP_032684642.1 protein yellow-like isoform X3 [Odontomachus brunneus]
MTRKKRNIGVQRTELSFRQLWTPKQTSRSNNYIYVPPNYAFGNIRDNPNPKYYRDLPHCEKLQPRDLPRKNRMANMVPWLLSMSLMGAPHFAAYTGPNILSRELQAPALPLTPSSVLTEHFSSTRAIDHKGSISAYNEHAGLPKLAVSANIGNPYGSTPQLRHHVATSNLGRNDFSRPTGRAIDTFHTDSHSVNQLDFHDFGDGFEPGHIIDDYVGPAMELVYAWPTIDFEFNNIEERDDAIFKGDYIAENNLPLGLEVWRDKVFITLPKWRSGIPATLSTVSRHTKTKNPKLKPYPNWHWHQSGSCDGLISVFRVQVDECDRLWVLDSGKIELARKSKQVCPPAIYIFDLRTDTLIRKFILPDEQIKQDSLYINIAVDIRDNDCGSAIAYLADVWRYGLVVYDLFKDSAYRIEHHFFYPDPLAARYELHGIKFQWTDGLFGIALSPVDIHNDKTLFFHPMSSFREFAVSTSIFRDKRIADRSTEKFMPVGRPRAKDYGHSSGSAIDRNGVMFFNMVTRDSVWCWDTRKEYIPQNLGVIGTSNVSLVFPNDIKVDHERDQSVWLLSNRLPIYLYGTLNSGSINYRIFKADVKEAIRDSVCDPNYVVPESDPGLDDIF